MGCKCLLAPCKNLTGLHLFPRDADRARLWLQAMGSLSAPDTLRMFVCNKRLSQDNFYRHENVSIARGSNIRREDAERSPTYLSISTGQSFHFSCWLAIQKFCPITTAEGGSLNMVIGLHVYQKHVGCELLDNDQPGLFLSLDAFNGQNTEEFTFDVTLRTFLEKEKNTVMRKLKPKVRLFRKPLTDSQGLQISCLATGFYPRHINLTLFRDGQPVDDDQITGGEILPNGDGTYQMRKSLLISSEELREGHKYNCTIKHLNLDNKLDIAFDEDLEKADFGSSALSIIISVLVLMCVAVLSISALIIWRKRCAAEISSRASHQSGYSPTSTSEQDTT
ncbi:hypothetical protein QQF64_031926 [Cirrhinus molitorella]|uniref:Major histocompatibility complex class I-related gene protein-like n=1 Tax=Cirrhinus molitorella TaxID=172907 RepID=A0ABR3MYG2_9TELE